MGYPKKVFFEDCFFLAGENVYEPGEDTYLIAEKISVSSDDIVLDMGTGCGIWGWLCAPGRGRKTSAGERMPCWRGTLKRGPCQTNN